MSVCVVVARKYPSGGLNLNAGHFSQLSECARKKVVGITSSDASTIVALMCLAQIVYQFYFYPYASTCHSFCRALNAYIIHWSPAIQKHWVSAAVLRSSQLS